MMDQLGFQTVVVPRVKPSDGIEVARMLFNQCYFEATKCYDGIQCLRRYRYGTGHGATRSTIHDEFSHGADAFRTFATATAVDWIGSIGPQTPQQLLQTMKSQKTLPEYDPFEQTDDIIKALPSGYF